jgi:hypothetical protein
MAEATMAPAAAAAAAAAAQHDPFDPSDDEIEVVNQETGLDDQDRLKRGIIERIQKGRGGANGLPKLDDKIALLKEAAKGMQAFLFPAFITDHAQAFAKLHAEMASIVGKKGKPSAESTATLLYSVYEMLEANSEHATARKNDLATGKKKKGRKDPPPLSTVCGR